MSDAPRITRHGSHSWFVRADPHQRGPLIAQLTAMPEVVDVTAGADDLLVHLTTGISVDHASLLLQAATDRATTDQTSQSTELIELPVTYDGPDLEYVALETGLSVEQVIERHSQTLFTASFCGFSPGFAYLTGLPEQLQLPRRTDPRAAVPAGSLAIAAEYSAIYPSASPGGWHLIGTCQVPLFDLERTPPATIRPGMRVRFTRVEP